MDPVVLDGRAVRLRPHRAADIAGIVEQCTDPQTVRWTTVPAGYGTAQAREFLAAAAAGWAAGTLATFAIADPGSDEFLGTLDIRRTTPGVGEVGFGLRASARGRGLMAAAVRVAAAWALDPGGLDLAVLHWRALLGNWPSRRVAWAAGFRVEGTVRGACGTSTGWIGSLVRGDPLRPAGRWLAAVPLAAGAVRLRPFATADGPRVREACTDPLSRQFLPTLPDPYTPAAARAYIESREEEHAAGRGVYWCAADPGSDACVGSFGLMDIDVDVASAEVGYWVHPAARGRGVATAAVRALAHQAFAAAADGGLGLHRLTLRAAGSNLASQRVARNAGFRPAGVARSAERLGDGSRDDLVCFDLLASDARRR